MREPWATLDYFPLFFLFSSLIVDNISYPLSSESLQHASSVLGCRQAEKCSCALELLKLGGTFSVSKNHTSIHDTQKLHSQMSPHVKQIPGSVPSPSLPIAVQACWQYSSGTQLGHKGHCSHGFTKSPGMQAQCLSHSAQAWAKTSSPLPSLFQMLSGGWRRAKLPSTCRSSQISLGEQSHLNRYLLPLDSVYPSFQQWNTCKGHKQQLPLVQEKPILPRQTNLSFAHVLATVTISIRDYQCFQ